MRRSARLTLLLTAALAAAAPAAAAQEPTESVAHPTAPKYTRLSDETELTRWAHVYARGKIRSRPSTKGRTIGRLRFQTEDELPEVYLLLRSTEVNGRTWVQIRIPKRPNGKTGWVRRHALGPFKTVRTRLVVNRRTLTATLYKRGRKVWSSRVGVGKGATPTPGGKFWIRERIRNLGGAGGPYGPWAFGTAAYSRLSDWPGGGVIGIHGTNQPHLIPGRPSHGCIRLPNWKITQLAKLMPVGTPLLIK